MEIYFVMNYWFLMPFTILYAIVVFIRNRLFDNSLLKQTEFEIPVIGVGNLSVGGTGKTPHVEYLVKLVSQKLKIAVLSRGYMRRTSGFILADKQSKAWEIGDEPKQIKSKFENAIVAVDEKRVHGIESLLNLPVPPEAVILDDAFQHRWVKPGMSILLMDFNHPVYEDVLLPSGRLREPFSEKRRSDIMIVTKCPRDLKPIDRRVIVNKLNPFAFQKVFFTTLNYGKLHPVFGKGQLVDFPVLESCDGCHVLLITGIARPKPVMKYLGAFSASIHHLYYPDHHSFTASEIYKITNVFKAMEGEKKIIITTEKDAFRLREAPDIMPLLNLPLYYLPVEIEFLFDEEKNFSEEVTYYLNNCSSIENSIKKSRGLNSKPPQRPSGF